MDGSPKMRRASTHSLWIFAPGNHYSPSLFRYRRCNSDNCWQKPISCCRWRQPSHRRRELKASSLECSGWLYPCPASDLVPPPHHLSCPCLTDILLALRCHPLARHALTLVCTGFVQVGVAGPEISVSFSVDHHCEGYEITGRFAAHSSLSCSSCSSMKDSTRRRPSEHSCRLPLACSDGHFF